MRSFFASFFGTLAALAIILAAAAAGLALLIGSASLKTEASVTVAAGSWLVLDMATPIQDAPLQTEGLENLTEMLGDHHPRILQTRTVTRALQAAAADPDIAGLYLSARDAGAQGAGGFGGLQEVRDAIVAFRATGKPVKAWISTAGTREYFLASAASEIALDPYGAVVLPGLVSQPMFFSGALEKIGIGVQVTRVGRFKSAVEPFTRHDMSPESRAQSEKLLGDLWSNVTHTMEDSRRLAPGAIQKAADTEGIVRADSAKALGLVDRIAYFDEILDELKKATDVTATMDPFRQVSLTDYADLVPGTNLAARRRATDAPGPSGHEKIAILYAEGPIVDGNGSEQGMVWGDRVAKQIRTLRNDETVKAIVLRVNSPGGSVNASEAIQRELTLFHKDRPVIVSMGSVAASGGYWISTAADRIFAEPTTITGSIGVFGIMFNAQTLATDRLGLAFDTVKTARFADSATPVRPKTPEELALIQKNVDWVYTQFLAKVAAARGMDVTGVDAIAEGRVWSGTEAKKIGLVDEIGGLDSAIALAAKKAAVGEEFAVVEYPERKTFLETFTEQLTRRRQDSAQNVGVDVGIDFGMNAAPDAATSAGLRAALASAGPLGTFFGKSLAGLEAMRQYNDPRGLYARLPFDEALR